MLGMQNETIFIKSCYRRNLEISVEIKEDANKNKKHASGVYAGVATQVMDFISGLSEEEMYTGIINCTTIEDVLKVEALLKAHDIKVKPFHGKLPKDEKEEALKLWCDGTVRVVVTTMAFGMGIDKATVKWVLHYGIPRSMENLVQEMGRAGRDEKRSVCKIMYSPSDKAKIQSALHKDPASLERQGKCLQSVVDFCTRINECRHWQVCAYFADDEGKKRLRKACEMCDVCHKTLTSQMKRLSHAN
jgi:bloom syndrome protein